MKFGPPSMTYNDNTSRALAYLLQKQDQLVDMTECIYRVEAEIPQASPAGVLLKSKITGGWLLSADSSGEQARLLDQVPERPIALTLHQQGALDKALDRFPDYHLEVLASWRFPSLEPPRFPLPFEVWPLDQGDVAGTLACNPTIPEKALRLQICRKLVYGACINDQLAGTVGTAPEGSISYLAVRPDLRGQGIGRTLFLYMLRRELQNGHIPFLLLSQQEEGLAPLAAQLGFVPSQQPVWRLVRPAFSTAPEPQTPDSEH